MMFAGIVLYRKSNGNEIVYSGTREDKMMGYVRTKQGVTFAEQTIGSILARGYWQVVTEEVTKHGSHDQSRHNPHKGGRGALAGGTRYEPEEIKDVYAEEGFELSDVEIKAVQKYVETGHKINGALRQGDPEEYVTDELKVSDIALGLDSAIASAPLMEDMAVWRVANVLSVEGLKVGDRVRDKGYASTTVADLTKPENGIMLLTLNGVSSGRKTLIEVNTGKAGKGLFVPAVGIGPTVDFEREFLLPRNSLMEYMGIRDFPLSSGKTMDIHQFKVVD